MLTYYSLNILYRRRSFVPQVSFDGPEHSVFAKTGIFCGGNDNNPFGMDFVKDFTNRKLNQLQPFGSQRHKKSEKAATECKRNESEMMKSLMEGMNAMKKGMEIVTDKLQSLQEQVNRVGDDRNRFYRGSDDDDYHYSRRRTSRRKRMRRRRSSSRSGSRSRSR